MTKYDFGYYEETVVDGLKWVSISKQECDSDAQAELKAKHLIERMQLTGMDLNPIQSVRIRRGDAEWAVSKIWSVYD